MIWLLASIPATFALLMAAEAAMRRFVAPRIAAMIENVPPFGVVPHEPDPHARHVSVVTSDGLTLRGSLHLPYTDRAEDELPDVPFSETNTDGFAAGECRGLVVFFPELRGNHWMAGRYCRALLKNGFAVISFDFRSQGSSDRMEGYSVLHWLTEYELRDIEAILGFISDDEELSTLPLSAFGVSRGGTAALAAAAMSKKIESVFADSAFTNDTLLGVFAPRWGRVIAPRLFEHLPQWHIRKALDSAQRFSERQHGRKYAPVDGMLRRLKGIPVQLVTGSRDSYVKPSVAEALIQAIGGDRCGLWLVPGAKHNMACEVAPEEYDRKVIEHFCRLPDAPSRAAEDSEDRAIPQVALSPE